MLGRVTTDWTRYDVVLDVPERATSLAFGVLLHGVGTVWFDDLSTGLFLIFVAYLLAGFTPARRLRVQQVSSCSAHSGLSLPRLRVFN